MRGLQFHENMIENQLAQARRAHGRRALRLPHPSAHRPRRQGRPVPDEHDGRSSTARELEYSVSGLMHPQYPAPDIKHLIDRLHTKGALRLLDLEITGPVELIPGVYCEAARRPYRGIDEHPCPHRRRHRDDLRRRALRHQRSARRTVPRDPRRGAAHDRQSRHLQARREGARSRSCSTASRFLLPVHDRPAKIEGGYVVGRLARPVPGPIVQSLPKRNWFPA